ncbi:MAG TPA: penicillin-insensitive murein endopeptidase [Polyangia bacterium]|jgi:penicillin-insensitive murein endopeptidase|nr:penicillin-insensitive murein endopeptidase [Polyangia bacterium]
MDLVIRLALLVAALAGDAGAPDAPVPPPDPRAIALMWSALPTPTDGPARAIGAYANGCLQGAVALPTSGPGYELIRPGRRRFFAHPEMIAFVQRFAAEARRQRLGPVLVGDLSQARGGPTPSGHRSHQTGLDADIGYGAPAGLRAGRVKKKDRELISPPVVVDLKTSATTAAWTPNIARLIGLAAADPAVDRVFVNPAIKRELCAATAKQAPAPWLGRVRPWWAHHDHFHVRLRCPPGDDGCTGQDPLPADDGCGASLAWWFTDDAEATRARRQAPPAEATPGPVLPEGCRALLPTEPPSVTTAR